MGPRVRGSIKTRGKGTTQIKLGKRRPRWQGRDLKQSLNYRPKKKKPPGNKRGPKGSHKRQNL